MYDASLQLLCSRKSGTLSRIVREIHALGLQYRGHKIANQGDYTLITIDAGGELNCTPENFAATLSGFAEVVEVRQVSLTRKGKPVKQVRTESLEKRIAASAAITPAIQVVAEKRLSEVLGPVASFLVESKIGDCGNAGELFMQLADELADTGERSFFLEILDRKS